MSIIQANFLDQRINDLWMFISKITRSQIELVIIYYSTTVSQNARVNLFFCCRTERMLNNPGINATILKCRMGISRGVNKRE
ncbi:MAG: hypothetical protein ACSLEN_04625 [Candidatus Malihini olakiniferum]